MGRHIRPASLLDISIRLLGKHISNLRELHGWLLMYKSKRTARAERSGN